MKFSRVRLLATPWTAAYQAPPSMGFSRQEYWSRVPLPSPAAAAAAAAKSLQSCPTLCDPMDCSPPGFSVHGILQARTLEWVAIIELEYHNFVIPNDTKIKVIVINAAKTIGWRTERELDKLCWGLGHPRTKGKQPESWALPVVHSTHGQLPSSDQPQSN